MNYGRALRTCRAARGMQQQELAKRSGLTKSYISLIENGDRTPSLKAIEALCSTGALDIPAHLFSLLAADSDDIASRPSEEIASLAQSLLRILVSSNDVSPSQERLL